MATDVTGTAEDGLPIQAVSDLLGVPAPTLRSWERRYGVPATVRSTGGHRRYPQDALQELRIMRDEVARGHSAAEAARRVLGQRGSTGGERVDALVEASLRMDRAAIHAELDRADAELGLPAALDEVLMPAMRQIGWFWAVGRCDVGQEHFTTAAVRTWLSRQVVFAAAEGRPVVLACGPRDFHTLGLEALGALLSRRGRESHLLGARTPAEALVRCVTETGAAAAVVVSQLPSHRRSAVEALTAVAATGCPTFYAGGAFLRPTSRRAVPGTFLGDRLTDAAETVLATVAV